MSIGEKLLNLRKEKGYSQEEVADKLNVSRQTISKWETDQSSPDFDKIVPLCDLYEISTEELLKGEKRKKELVQNIQDNNVRRKSTAKVVSISVFLYFMSVIWVIVGSEVLGLNGALMISIFLLICGISTVLLVYHFISLPEKKKIIDEKKKKENKKFKSITSIVSTIFTIIYLLVSFLTMAWHITWIIWLVYAVVIEIIKIIYDFEEENE